jgi:hypothetical protein
MLKNQRGISLIVVVFAMMLFAILGWTLAILQSGNFETVMRQSDSERAFYLADSGIQHGLRKLGNDSTWRTTGVETYTLGNGQYTISSVDGKISGQIEVTSTGYIPSTANGYRAKRVIKVTVTVGSWNKAISAITLFDWYKMLSGSYINGDITAGNFDGDGNATLNQLGADYDHPPTAKPPGTTYKRDIGSVSMPDIDMNYYKNEAIGVSEYISAPYVFVADYSNGGSTPGLIVINNIPAGPTIKGNSLNFNYSYKVHGYFTYSNKWYTCVASGTNGFKIFEVTNPASPTLTKTVTTTAAYGVFTDVGEGYAANYAYVADGTSGMRVIHISTPGSASVAKTFALGSGTARGIFLRDTYAFVSAGSLNASGENGKLYIVNVSNPTSPSLAATVSTAGYGGGGVYVRGQYAFVACGTDGTKGILQIYNVSNPSSPTLRATVNLPGGSCAYGVYVKGRYAYVAAGTYGLQIVDVAGLSYSYFTPSIVGSYRPDTNEAKAVHVSGTCAYIAYSIPGLRIVDVSNPAAPSLSGSYDTNDASGVFVLGDKVFDANHNNDKVWYTVGTMIIKGGKYNHTSMAAEGDIEIMSAGGIAFKAHVTTSANENFPNLASRDGSIISSNAVSDSYDGLIFSKNGIIDFNGISSQGVLMAYDVFLGGNTGVSYSGKYVGSPPSGFVSGVSVLTWQEIQ